MWLGQTKFAMTDRGSTVRRIPLRSCESPESGGLRVFVEETATVSSTPHWAAPGDDESFGGRVVAA